MLSVVVPAYNEEESIEHVFPALTKVLAPQNIDFELIFIDDGSSDFTYRKIEEQSKTASNIRGYRFSKNFGKEAAIWAGLSKAKGDCCVVMDCDLQHPPEVLPQMYRLWQDGYEIVEGIKARRGKETIFHKVFSGLFYRIIAALSGLDMRSSSDFKLLDKRVVSELMQLKERNAFFRGLSFWVGFRATKLEYFVMPRVHGKTKWGLLSLTRYAVSNIIGFSTAPLQLVTIVGAFLLLGSVILGVHTLVRSLMGYSLAGFPTVILLLLLIGGCLMLSLGIIGLYIAKIYEEVKARPRFIIMSSTAEPPEAQ
ncbi:MAG: glycosyltransferase family 2 protein [Oscillospiraceae bacterium]|nr:glycosyltransferase family 2 protein [Oscillospiraceae bacterium]